MRLFAALLLIIAGLSAACEPEQNKPAYLPASKGILKGRPDPAEQKFFIKRYGGCKSAIQLNTSHAYAIIFWFIGVSRSEFEFEF